MSEKIHITIDGQQILTEPGLNLLQVARDNNINIPGLCYHKRLSPTGACRLCLVKVEGMKGIQASCALKTMDKMEVTAFDEELDSMRTEMIDYLLAEHNEDNDGSYEDELLELVQQYDLEDQKSRSFPDITRELNFRIDDTSPVLTYDASKCIKCFRCIKACDEIQGKNILSFSDRGIDSHIIAGFDFWGNSECDGCGECIQLCPTGAIVENPHRDMIKLDQIEKKVQTTCPYCGVGCQIELLVQNGRIVRSNGVEGVMPNDGRLCVKGRFGYDYVQSEERLTHPLIKKNGEFVRASWDEALELIASQFNKILDNQGPDALGGYGSAKCTNEDNYIFQKFMRTVLGTNNQDYCTRLCHASTVTAMLKSIGDGAGSNSIEDFKTTDCLFIIGNNIIETHPITATYVKEGAREGQEIVVVDPKWTPAVKYANLWLQPKLGTDVALLNGLIHVVIKEELIDTDFIQKRVEHGMEAFEELRNVSQKYTPEYVEEVTGVAAHDIEKAARIYAKAPTAMIATGMGMSQQVTGTNNVFSLINLMLITGQIGKERAGIDPPRGQNNVQGTTDIGVSPTNYPGYIPVSDEENRRKVAKIWDVPFESLPSKPGLTTIEIIQAAHEGNIKGMYIMGENPVMTDPNQSHTIEALENLDFLVVQDIFHTETTPYADVILPASSFAEKDGTFVNSDRRVLRVRKAVEMPGNAKEDWKIIDEIANRMGKPMNNPGTASEIFDEIARVTPIMAGISYDRIKQEGIQWPCPEKNHPGTSTLFLEKFNTASGKAKIFPVEYVPQSESVSEEYPFMLNTGRILFHYHTATMSRRNKALTDYENEAYVLMHPYDASKKDIHHGENVRITSSRGSLDTHVRISNQVLEKELFMPFHFAEAPVNKLTRNEMDPDSKIAPFKLSACKVEKI
ncbi:MAG: formate dehydrogenase subunit alpha [Bacteroidales bacterium]|nr:formate dehydrogenase subunit alpha [Bacteroidales bacterium]MCF8326698.1 formate dehydrogenase subunit alpha [Bacteroidales bacterium]